MGPVMTILPAFVPTTLVLLQGAAVPVYEDQPPVVGTVTRGSPAEKADIRPGDLLIAVADHPVKTWEQFLVAVGSRPLRETTIDLQRHGRGFRRTVTPGTAPGQSRFDVGDIGVMPNVHPHLTEIRPGEPGERGGLKTGDLVVGANGETITFGFQLRDVIAKHPEQPITLTVVRDG